MIEPELGASVVETIQRNVDAILAAGGIPALNHPNFRWAITASEMAEVNGLKLFEVYNGHPSPFLSQLYGRKPGSFGCSAA